MVILDYFQTKMFKSETTSLHYFSPHIGPPILGSGGKKTFKRYLKSEHTDGHTGRRTNGLIESIGPEGRCFENLRFREEQKKSQNPKVFIKKKINKKKQVYHRLQIVAPKTKTSKNLSQKNICQVTCQYFFYYIFIFICSHKKPPEDQAMEF